MDFLWNIYGLVPLIILNTISPQLQAAVISGLVVLITLYHTRKMNNENRRNNEKIQREITKKNIDANITAKSRIEWIQSARNTTTDFLECSYSTLLLFDVITIGESKQIEPVNNGLAAASISISKEISKNMKILENDRRNFLYKKNEVNKFGIMLSLYFGPDDSGENQFVLDLIDTIRNNISKNTSLATDQIEKLKEMIDDLRDILRTYYKIEWKRASGSLTNDMEEQTLSSHELYISLRKKYNHLEEQK